jgi:SNF2 family DNA or RNA helicase
MGEKSITIGLNKISLYQDEIVTESLEKGSGGAHLPMGTGKTLIYTLVSIMQAEKISEGKVLVVAAKSLIPTWREEIEKHFGDSIQYEVFHKEYIKDMETWVPKTNFILTTPEVLSKIYKKYEISHRFFYTERPVYFGPLVKNYNEPLVPFLDVKIGERFFYSIKWASLVVDEAHNYLNISSLRCLAISSLSSHHRWLLSGTLFTETKIEKLFGYNLLLNKFNCSRNLPEFTKYMDSHLFTGMNETLIKRDGNKDFKQPKIENIVISHSMTKSEEKIYTGMKSILNVMKKRLEKYKLENDKINAKKFSSYILSMINYLRQCIVCPLIPITNVALDFLDFKKRSEFLEIFVKCIKDMGIEDWLNDKNSLYSSRIHQICQNVDKHKQEKITIFSCYRMILDVLKVYLPKDRPVFTISGNQKIEKRSQVIKDFFDSDNGILLLTYDIGSNGLNLQCSSVAILVDFWWNVGKSDQAIARILRPGQKSDKVTFYRFTSNTGMENALFKLQKSKISREKEVLVGKIDTKIEKIQLQKILRLIDEKDNISILDSIISV